MKFLNLTVAISMMGSLAFANNFKVEDFNQMIQESQEAEADLRKNLQQGAGIRFDDRPGHISREKLEIPAEVEQVVVNTEHPTWRPVEGPSRKAQDRARMKRLSQELEETR